MKKPEAPTTMADDCAEALNLLMAKHLAALRSNKPMNASAMVAAHRFLESPVLQEQLRRQAAEARRTATAYIALDLPTFEPDKYDRNGARQAAQEPLGETPRIGRYPSDPEEH